MKATNFSSFVKGVGVFALTLASFKAFAQQKPMMETPASKRACKKSCKKSCGKSCGKSKLDISGSVDAYHRYDYLSSNISSEANDTPTLFANQTGFVLGTANVKAAYQTGNVGAVIDASYGERADLRAASEMSTSTTNRFLNQAYVYWNASDKTTLTLGKIATFLGQEKLSAAENTNYSSSYIFSSNPLTYTGVTVDYDFSDNWYGTLGVFNQGGSTYTQFDNYTLGAKVGYNKGKAATALAVTHGREGMTAGSISRVLRTNLTTKYKASDAFAVALDAIYNIDLGDTTQNLSNLAGTGVAISAEEVYGVAVYPTYQVNQKLELGLRAEYYGAEDISNNGTDAVAATLTGNYKVADALTIKPELRFDHIRNNDRGDHLIFTDSNGDNVPNLASFIVAAVYQF